MVNQADPVTLSTDAPVWMQTDASGNLTLAISAFDDGTSTGTPNVACPPVFAWANFMSAGEAIVIYPKHYLLEYAGDRVPIAISLLSGLLCLGYLAAVSSFLVMAIAPCSRPGASGRGEARPGVAVPFPAGVSPSKSSAAKGRAG